MRIESVRDGASGAVIVTAGGFSFSLNVEGIEALGLDRAALAPGTELDDVGEALLRLAAEAYEAERRGLALLARAEQSAFLMRGKLELRGFSSRAVGLAIERLICQGWLDDSRFFASVYRLAPRKAYGGASEPRGRPSCARHRPPDGQNSGRRSPWPGGTLRRPRKSLDSRVEALRWRSRPGAFPPQGLGLYFLRNIGLPREQKWARLVILYSWLNYLVLRAAGGL